LPEQDRLFKILKKFVNKGPFRDVTEDIYRQMQGESVDYAILEKANNVFVVESSFSWTDLGTWDELYRLSMKDARNNVIEGDVIAINTANCLVNSSNKLIGIVGVDNLIVIDSNDALLICKRGHTEDVKEIVDFIRRKHINKFL
jgi:mannose-1-phosphate guanylyltransferase